MGHTKKTRAVLLCRTASKKATNAENGILLQRNILRPWIEQQGYDLVKEITESGVGCFKIPLEKRDAIHELKKMAVNKEFDVLVVYKGDRLCRTIKDIHEIIDFLNSHGIKVISYCEGEITTAVKDRFTAHLRHWNDEEYEEENHNGTT